MKTGLEQDRRRSCRIYLMSDRQMTIDKVSAYAQEKYNCSSVTVRNRPTMSNSSQFKLEHGANAGVGYFQGPYICSMIFHSQFLQYDFSFPLSDALTEPMFVKHTDLAVVGQAQSAFVSSERSSSMVVLELMEYTRRLRMWNLDGTRESKPIERCHLKMASRT
jgi:hypothetical protein